MPAVANRRFATDGEMIDARHVAIVVNPAIVVAVKVVIADRFADTVAIAINCAITKFALGMTTR